MSLDDWVDLPPWLSAPANAVLDDLQRGEPVPGVTLRVNEEDGMDGPVLGLFEPDGSGGGRLVSRSLDPVDLLLCVAEILQDELDGNQRGLGPVSTAVSAPPSSRATICT